MSFCRARILGEEPPQLLCSPTSRELPRSFASLRMTADGLRMTALKGFSATSEALPFRPR